MTVGFFSDDGMARRVRPNLNSVNRAVQRNALKAAINRNLRAYMNDPQSNLALQNVNGATKALIRTYIEEHDEKQAPANVPSGNGGNGNKPLMLSNKPHTNNGNGGNNANKGGAIVPVGSVTPLGPNLKAPLPKGERGANERPREPTAVNLNRLRNIAKNGASPNNVILKNQINFVNALTRNFPNHPNVKAAKNAVNARKAAKSITAGAITEARVQADEAASTAASGRNKLRAAAAAARGASLLKAAGANARRQKLLNEAKRREAMNAAHANFMRRINATMTMNNLNTINRNIAGANLDNKATLRRKIAIQKKKIEGLGVKAERALARATRPNNALASANLNRGKLMNRYSKYREEISAAPTNKELNRLVTVLGGNTGKLFSENEKKNARAAINRKRNSLKGPGPSPNAPKNGGPNNVNRASKAELEQYLRLIEGRKKSGTPLNKNANFERRVRARLNVIRPPKKSWLGHIGGAVHYVGAGTAHHATRGVKAAAGIAVKGAQVAVPLALAGAAYLGQQGARRGFNVTVGGGKKPSKKIPNTSLNNGNKKPGKLERAVQKNENIAAARKAYQRSVGGNASENSVSAAGALGALAVAGGAHTAARAAAALKRASNLGRVAKTGMYSAKTLRYAAK
jgi:hypothetical protein